MIRAILTEQNLLAAPAKYRRPYTYLLACMRATNPTILRLQNVTGTQLRTVGQTLFAWGPPDGYPDTAEYWSGGALPRWNFAQYLATNTADVPVDINKFMTTPTPVGVVDAMRIGTDVAPSWGGRLQRWATGDQGGRTARLAARNTLTRAVLHGHLWANDPDCLLVRTDRSRLTDAEVRLLVAVGALTDGMLVSGDRLDLVPPDRLDLLRLAHDLAGGRARVPDLFARSEPETRMPRSRNMRARPDMPEPPMPMKWAASMFSGMGRVRSGLIMTRQS